MQTRTMPPKRGTREHLHWSAGARHEAALRYEGLTPQLREALQVTETLVHMEGVRDAEELTTILAVMYAPGSAWRRIRWAASLMWRIWRSSDV